MPVKRTKANDAEPDQTALAQYIQIPMKSTALSGPRSMLILALDHMSNCISLTHYSLAAFLWDAGKQY